MRLTTLGQSSTGICKIGTFVPPDRLLLQEQWDPRRSLMSDEFITTDDFIDAHYSPRLQAIKPVLRHRDTPPPLDLLDDNYSSDTTATTGEGDGARSRSAKGRPQPSLCDSLLIKLLGPDYPDVASIAGREFITLSPEIACEDRRPVVAALEDRMLDDTVRRAVSSTSHHDRMLARAAFEASEKFHAAVLKDGRGAYPSTILQSRSPPTKHSHTFHVHEIEPELVHVPYGVSEPSPTPHYSMAQSPPSRLSPPDSLNVKPPPRVSLPAIRTRSPGPRTDWAKDQVDSIATSPALAKFTITAADANSQQQLPKLHTSPAQPTQGHSPRPRQTLPSLKTALGDVPDAESASYSAHSTAGSRPSPHHYAQFGPSPSHYSNPPPASAISPPRVPTNPLYWQTTRPDATNHSTPSDHTSTGPSAGISTPATSYFGHSPSSSVNTPSTIVPDLDNMSSTSGNSSQLTDGGNQYNGSYGNGSFRCNFPGCNAPPFQTQYLLNSHANVHSNTRPHFCPVQGCTRGPGGQGFKRKNEMIRHGLVHQSPGYVCPFCPDQQHKYPRPDNLQRHVRVHHVDRDRDDPLLRDVLAQRPEGGNRGRRRRLGS